MELTPTYMKEVMFKKDFKLTDFCLYNYAQFTNSAYEMKYLKF